MRVIVSQVVRVRLSQPVIALATISLLVLPPHTEEKDYARDGTYPKHAQGHAVAGRVSRSFAHQEYVRSDDSANVTEANCYFKSATAKPLT